MIERDRVENALACLLHLALVSVLVAYGESGSRGYTTFRAHLNATETFPEADLVVYPSKGTFNVYLAAVFVEVITAVAHLGYATALRGWYVGCVEKGIFTFLWAEYALTAPLMADVMLFLFGGRLVDQLLLNHAVFVMIIASGYWFQVAYTLRQDLTVSATVMSLGAGALAFVLWIDSMAFAYAPNHADAPGWVLAILIVVIALFACFMAPFLYYLDYFNERFDGDKDRMHWAMARSYIVLSWTAKAVLFGVMTANVFAQ